MSQVCGSSLGSIPERLRADDVLISPGSSGAIPGSIPGDAVHGEVKRARMMPAKAKVRAQIPGVAVMVGPMAAEADPGLLQIEDAPAPSEPHGEVPPKEPYTREDHDLGGSFEDYENPLSKARKRAATWATPNACWYPQAPKAASHEPREESLVSGDWRVAPMDKTRHVPPASERSGYIVGLLGRCFGSFGSKAAPDASQEVGSLVAGRSAVDFGPTDIGVSECDDDFTANDKRTQVGDASSPGSAGGAGDSVEVASAGHSGGGAGGDRFV